MIIKINPKIYTGYIAYCPVCNARNEIPDGINSGVPMRTCEHYWKVDAGEIYFDCPNIVENHNERIVK
jgi:hypothetical protein